MVCFFAGALAIFGLHKFGVRGFQHDEDFGAVLLGTLCFQGVTWMLIPFFLRVHRVDWREAFGFRAPQLKRSLLLAVVVMILFAAPAAWWLQIVSDRILSHFGWPVEEQTAVTIFKSAKAWVEYGYLSLFAVILAPVAEEFIFRGMLFPFFKQSGFPKLAWLGVSFLFALIHQNLNIFASLFVLALVLTWLYEKTDSLLAPITAHALFNVANLVILDFSQ